MVLQALSAAPSLLCLLQLAAQVTAVAIPNPYQSKSLERDAALVVREAAAKIGNKTPSKRQTPFDSSEWPLPHNITGDEGNSIGWGGVHVHDPSVIKAGDTWYSFASHSGIVISSSPSLDGPWTTLGTLLGTSIIDLPGNADIWAPSVHLVGSTYYCYYAVSTLGSETSAIGVATASSTDLSPGKWTDLGEVFSSDPTGSTYPLNVSNAIDPYLLYDDDVGYLSYGSYWQGIFLLPLNDDLTSISVTDGVVDGYIHAAYDTGSTNHFIEGSSLSYNDGYYYSWFSHGKCCKFNVTIPVSGNEYSIRVGRSESIEGPYIDYDGVSLLEGGGSIVYDSNNYVYAPGGQGITSDGDRDILYFEYFDQVGVEDRYVLLGWDYIDYVDGWPVLSYD